MKPVFLLLPLMLLTAYAQRQPGSAGQVPAPDLKRIKVSDFADNELDLPYYAANFYRVANAVPLDGELRGWITTSVWRGNSNQRTYNARVLESQLSLVYFFCTKRPWNPYFDSPAVRARLEAMLERWCNMQGANGEFSEYGAGRWSLAPTAFATKFMGESLRLLAQGPPIDAALLKRAQQAQRKAILATLKDPDFWRHGEEYANQFSNVFASGLAWLAMYREDTEVRVELFKRMKEALTGLQSPAGYFYERGGSDWGYSLSTHHSNLQLAWKYGHGTAFEPLIIEMTRRYYDWLSWNAVIEPDGSGFVLNRAIETRQRRPWLGVEEDPARRNFASVPQAAVVKTARAFLPSRTEVDAARSSRRAELERNWPNLGTLEEGDFRAFTPYAFLQRAAPLWFPDTAQQIAARAALPYMKDGRYAHLRADNRHNMEYLFVRRPAYYAIFNSGEKLADQQRFGLGLLWNREVGTLAQSQSASSSEVWGTTIAGAQAPCEAENLRAVVEVSGKKITPQPGAEDLGAGSIEVSYPLGNSGNKNIRFEDTQIVVQTEQPGDFVESIPLLLRETDRLRLENGQALLERGRGSALALKYGASTAAEVMKGGAVVGPYHVVAVNLKAKDKLVYAVVLTPDKLGSQANAAAR